MVTLLAHIVLKAHVAGSADSSGRWVSLSPKVDVLMKYAYQEGLKFFVFIKFFLLWFNSE